MRDLGSTRKEQEAQSAFSRSLLSPEEDKPSENVFKDFSVKRVTSKDERVGGLS